VTRIAHVDVKTKGGIKPGALSTRQEINAACMAWLPALISLHILTTWSGLLGVSILIPS
jgi:hypothetical protein